jgi:hypothetical protein
LRSTGTSLPTTTTDCPQPEFSHTARRAPPDAARGNSSKIIALYSNVIIGAVLVLAVAADSLRHGRVFAIRR